HSLRKRHLRHPTRHRDHAQQNSPKRDGWLTDLQQLPAAPYCGLHQHRRQTPATEAHAHLDRFLRRDSLDEPPDADGVYHHALHHHCAHPPKDLSTYQSPFQLTGTGLSTACRKLRVRASFCCEKITSGVPCSTLLPSSMTATT